MACSPAIGVLRIASFEDSQRLLRLGHRELGVGGHGPSLPAGFGEGIEQRLEHREGAHGVLLAEQQARPGDAHGGLLLVEVREQLFGLRQAVQLQRAHGGGEARFRIVRIRQRPGAQQRIGLLERSHCAAQHAELPSRPVFPLRARPSGRATSRRPPRDRWRGPPCRRCKARPAGSVRRLRRSARGASRRRRRAAGPGRERPEDSWPEGRPPRRPPARRRRRRHPRCRDGPALDRRGSAPPTPTPTQRTGRARAPAPSGRRRRPS